MNKQTLKKHHFWVLSGIVPLLIFISFLLVVSGVGGAIDDQQGKIKKADDSLKGKLPAQAKLKSEKLITELNGQVDDLVKKKGEMWKQNYLKEKELFTWPAQSAKLQGVAKLDIPFGDTIPNTNSEREEFKNERVYLAEFEQMAASVAPTLFWSDGTAGGPGGMGGPPMPEGRGSANPNKPQAAWTRVLRHVNDWGLRAPDSNTLWLALEDIWVQRSLLGAVKAVNDQIATFTTPTVDRSVSTPVPHYKCQSRNWEVELWIERRGSNNVVKGKLRNLTDRLQILGVGNTMRLQVWLDNKNLNDPKSAFEFAIEGEFVKANAFAQATDKDPSPVIKEIPSHTVLPGIPVTGVFKVRQKFDIRTVPVRRIDVVALNYKDSRHADRALVPFKAEVKPEGADGTGMPMPGGVGGPSGAGGAGMPMPPGPGRMPGEAGGAPGAAGMAGGTVESVLLANKDRYLESTGQVRRMPVGMVVVLDQMYSQDFLVALANMPLRFQLTQTHWSRFRGTLPNGNQPTTGPGGIAGMPGMGDPGAAGLPEGMPLRTTGDTLQGSGFSPSDDPYSRAFPRRPVPNLPPPGSPFGPAGSLTTVSEGQLTAGLINLSVYGIVSLYKKYEEPKPGTETAGVP